jgi:hypothetical protein
MKQVLLIAALIVVGNAAFVFAGGLRLLEHTSTQTAAVAAPSTGAVDAFQNAIEGTVVTNMGQPKNGFTPAMFLKYFPGLAPTDFEGVQSSIGHYTIENGKIEHVLDTTQLIHQAAGAISRQGIATLLTNVSQRTGIDLTATGTVTDIMQAITKPIGTSNQ